MNKEVRKIYPKEIDKLQKLAKQHEMDYLKLKQNYEKKIKKTKINSRRKAELSTTEKIKIAGAIGVVLLSIIAFKHIDNKYFEGKLTHEEIHSGNNTDFIDKYLDPTYDKEKLIEEYGSIDYGVTEKHKGGK